jgi:hypothetical protein
VKSQGCSDSGHLVECRELMQCSHCEHSERCVKSAYLVHCSGLRDCNYCFGCVGLSGKDFHILNEPYERSRYFEVTQQLRRALGLR